MKQTNKQTKKKKQTNKSITVKYHSQFFLSQLGNHRSVVYVVQSSRHKHPTSNILHTR